MSQAQNPGPSHSRRPPPPLAPLQEVVPQPKTGKGSRAEKTKQDNDAKELVRRKLDETREYTLRFIDDGLETQSPAWKNFAQVYDPSSEKDVPFVRCRKDCKVIKMLTRGRGNLAAHVCPRQLGPITRPNQEIKNDFSFRSTLVQLCVQKLIPTRIVDSEEFETVIQNAIEIGAKCGPIKANEIIPSSKTLATHMKELADRGRAVLASTVKEDVEDGLASSTVDGWTENFHKRKILGCTMSVIPENFELTEYTLFAAHCDSEIVDGDMIRSEIETNLERLEFGDGSNIHFVSDDGADIVKALEGKSRTYYMDHALNLCVKKAIQPQLTKTDLYGAEGGALLDAVGTAVDVIKSCRKRTPQIAKLKASLAKGPHAERRTQKVFKSCVPMLESAKKNLTKVKNELAAIGRGDLLQNITEEDVNDVINIVKPIEALAKSNKHISNTFKGSHFLQVHQLTKDSPTDSNLTKALKSHIKNTLLPILYILSVMKKCKEIVTFFKSSGLNDSLEGGNLVQEVETRWMSMLHLLRSFFIWPSSQPLQEDESLALEDEEPQPSRGKVDQINEILTAKGKLALVLKTEDTDLMLQVIDILKPFEGAIKKFEFSKSITIQHVIPQYRKLQKFLAPNTDDSPNAAVFRAALLQQLENKVPGNISMRHKMGMFFWPRFASLPGFSETERTQILDHVRQLCKEQDKCMRQRGKLTEKSGGQEQEPAAKRRRRRRLYSDSDEEYESLLSDEVDLGSKDEVETYMALADKNVRSEDILSWWEERVVMFPILSRVVRMVLATPASSASSERIFSTARQIITPKRSNMLPEILDDHLFLNSFLKQFSIAKLST
ncbi:Transposable element Hobo transposase [Frankliniella fusca]|uniref:Transposable element Hobo transposase n=1 Tax=Frankliniella fusca TaxID=407009 RepID=A0AAE1LWW9_9NEOP|nr:Transposable element Hobo transposase [Frankliniella fusca]